MLEKWVGKSVTYYIMGEEGYAERLLVAVDARGIYVKRRSRLRRHLGLVRPRRHRPWTTRPDDVSAFWTTRGGAPRAIMLGLVDTANALTLVREIDPNGGSPDVDYSVIGPSSLCADALPGTGTGIGAAGAGLPVVDCDDTGCTVFSYRVLGVPRFDMPGEYIPQLTYIVGAPGAPAGGAGSITVLYTESGDGNVENPACAPSWP